MSDRVLTHPRDRARAADAETRTPTTWTPMSQEQRERFERDGYLILPGVLTTDEAGAYAEALDRVVAAAEGAGDLEPDGSLHRL
ncbi:MAG TPA: hypothetical protein VFP13_01205, partial [Actinomycetota bacterium]|nr:hypothetical protein [Actinomycetota bacterium]